ncbi:29309_t:CDS:2 [Gigaspora margarita]|uniref:29309_t:CDS:1 n=1 Tax=Gigaspora margarita TaxID=4874 RepID=A0ABN7UCT7_GIGMA|nr:29309_t:CDS:2 [Gigaspora margarita]
MNIDKAEHEFVVGTYSVGKEKVFWENPELEVLLTNNPHEASVHIMCLTKIKAEGLIYYLQSLQPTFKMSWHFGQLGGLIKPSTFGTFSTSSTIEEMLNDASSLLWI